MANFTNQLAKFNKTLERMESQLEISKTINKTLEKCISNLDKQCSRNEQYLWRECVEIVGWMTKDKQLLFFVPQSMVTFFQSNRYITNQEVSTFPSDWHVTFSANHWSNEDTMSNCYFYQTSRRKGKS